METFLIAFVIFTVAVLGMAIGVLSGRQAIKGSCGGLNTIKGFESACPACSGSCKDKAKKEIEPRVSRA